MKKHLQITIGALMIIALLSIPAFAADAPAFTAVKIDGSFGNVTIQCGRSSHGIFLVKDEKETPIKGQIANGTLLLSSVTNPTLIGSDHTIIIKMAELKKLDLGGTSEVTINDNSTALFTFHLAGTCNAKASGKIGRIILFAKDTTNLKGKNLICQDAVVQTGMTANVTITVKNSLTAKATDASSITYYGKPDPKKVKVQAGMAASIERK